MPITVGQEVLDQEIGAGTDFDWEPGWYRGRIVKTERRPNEGLAEAEAPWEGFATQDAEEVSVQLGQIDYMEQPGSEYDESIGDRNQFVNIVIRDGHKEWSNIDPTEESEARKLVTGFKRGAKLANALGLVNNGGLPDDFVELLSGDNFEGSEVLFKLRRYSIDGNEGVYVSDFDAA